MKKSSMTEVVTMINEISMVTRISGKKVGNALKSVYNRIK